MECPYCHTESNRRKDTNRYFCMNPECTHQTFTVGLKAHSKTITKPTSKIGMSVKDFRERFDVEYIVDKTLKALDQTIIYEKSDLYKLTGLRAGYPGLAATLEDKKFSEYKGRVGGKDYFSHPDTIKELIETAILS